MGRRAHYQARNLLREASVGDGVIFYHSSADPPAAVGTAVVARAAYPDETQFDPRSDHYDRESKKDDPRWFVVDLKFERKFARPVTLVEMRGVRALADMVLLRKGSRLSVQPVTAGEWKTVLRLGGAKAS